MGRFIRHTNCDRCGSSDANAVYEDGSTHCFSCRWTKKSGSEGFVDTDFQTEETTEQKAFVEGEAQAIANRGLTQATCEFWKYEIGTDNGEPCHIANYRDSKGRLIAQKVRKAGKKFKVVGNGRNMPLYGQWLWNGGKSVVITEGEIDALSVSQAFDNKYAVVSLPNGAQSAVKSIQNAYEWLDGFEKIVLCFDNDEPGQQAMEEVAAILPAGKAYIMSLPTKDANEALIHHGPGVITKSFWNARAWRPDGIVQAEDLRQEVLNPIVVETIKYPYQALNERIGGMRIGEMVVIGAGTGVGKSTLARNLIYYLSQKGEPVGVMALEESNKTTMEYLMSIHMKKNIVISRDGVTDDSLEDAFNAVATSNLYLFDHFGSTKTEHLLNRIRYMVRALGVRWVFLDHISMVVSGLDVSGGDERKLIDKAMTDLRTLVSELNIGLFVVTHLRRPEGDKGHEDGAPVRLSQMRGSHSIGQLANIVIGVQKDPDEPHSNRRELVVLKNRWSGNTGGGCVVQYDQLAGTLEESIF